MSECRRHAWQNTRTKMRVCRWCGLVRVVAGRSVSFGMTVSEALASEADAREGKRMSEQER